MYIKRDFIEMYKINNVKYTNLKKKNVTRCVCLNPYTGLQLGLGLKLKSFDATTIVNISIVSSYMYDRYIFCVHVCIHITYTIFNLCLYSVLLYLLLIC